MVLREIILVFWTDFSETTFADLPPKKIYRIAKFCPNTLNATIKRILDSGSGVFNILK